MCKQDKDTKLFADNKRRPDGLQSQCKTCHKAYRRKHYEDNRKKYIDKAAYWRKEFVKWWKAYKATFSCVECGESHPACIHFHHHNDDKEDCVACLVSTCNKQRVMKEVAKCTPVCANCHAKIHWRD